MARGKKTGGKDFLPGETGNKSGRPKVPAEIKEARLLNKVEVEMRLNKFLDWPLAKVVAFTQAADSSTLDVLIARILVEAIKRGDQFRLDFILNRLVGKVEEKVNHSGQISLHAQMVGFMKRVEDRKKPEEEIDGEND